LTPPPAPGTVAAIVAQPAKQLSGTVLRARSGFYTVRTDDGILLECRLRGLLRKDRQTTALAVIGDRVTVLPLEDGQGMIEAVEPRRSKFSRRQPGPRGAWMEDLVVANVDQVLVVFACANPMPHLRMVDRFLVVAEHNQVEPVVVANKVDLVGLEAARRLFGGYEAIGYPVHYTSAREGIGVEQLADRLAGRTSVVTGPSGVGKSTLLNAIQPGLHIETGEVSALLTKGRHTTTAAELHPLETAANGYVADTPGLRELGLWQVPSPELAWCFPEMRPSLGRCAFNDCRHLSEPRCAVLAAVATGEISPERYDSYRRLQLNED
jgi:ribosome biogenesis GTPase / thiamine phosphate phosphatase